MAPITFRALTGHPVADPRSRPPPPEAPASTPSLPTRFPKWKVSKTTPTPRSTNFLSGEGEELHKVALATQQADLSFQLFMQVRNKVVTAYNQVMQMQV